jgi:F-type H+-transporting ATPase subunit gamma
MANLRELRGRIKSISSIAQITRAMEMVASMKLRKVQAKAMTFHPYTEEVRSLVDHVAGHVAADAELPLFRQREVKTTGILLITSDRGLCGSYNSNVFNRLRDWEKSLRAQHPDRVLKFYCYGRKGYSYLNRRGYDIERFFVEPPLDKADYGAARMVSEALVSAFESRTVDQVAIFYTRFTTSVRFDPTHGEFLPMGISLGEAIEQESPGTTDYLLEPQPSVLLNHLVPRYLGTVIYDAMMQSLASEYASRRIAMKGATDAASRMGKDLKRIYNRARQESITKELLDIIGGTAAVS